MARNAGAQVTIDHEEIQHWVEERGGSPACVRGTGSERDPGMIRIDMPGYSGADSLEQISWDDWFQAFDENKLAFLHQDTTAEGERSNFNKLIARETAEKRARGVRGASRNQPQGRSRRTAQARNARRSRAHRASAVRRKRTQAQRRTRVSASTRSRSTRAKSSRRGRTRRPAAVSKTRRSSSAQAKRSRRSRAQSRTRVQSRSRSLRSQSSKRGGKVLVARSKIRRLKKDVKSLGRRAA